jgi:hypothetical protein
MPRKAGTKQLNIAVSEAQYSAFLRLAAQRGMSPADYARWLMKQDAQTLGDEFPDDLTRRGKYERK